MKRYTVVLGGDMDIESKDAQIQHLLLHARMGDIVPVERADGYDKVGRLASGRPVWMTFDAATDSDVVAELRASEVELKEEEIPVNV